MIGSGNPRILLVEDEVLIALHLSEMLESSGFEVIGPCQTVAQALAKLELPHCCDVAILDTYLRDESAIPVARTLNLLRIPFFVVTGYNRAQLADEFESATILAKPVDMDALISEVHRCLAN
jgi:DNA-binding NtrC family response regulator